MSETRTRLRLGAAAWVSAAILVLTGCGSGSSSSSNSSSGIPSDRKGLISAFPADVQPLFTSDIPDAVIASLLKVRRAGPGTLILNDAGGELFAGAQTSYINNWQKITGWTVKDVAPSPDPGQVKAQVQTGHPQFDLFETGSNGDAINEQQQGLLQKLDMNLLNPLIDKFPKGAGYEHSDYWIQYSFFGVLLIWDTRKWPASGTHPSTPNDLFNTSQFPGKRCLYKYPEYAGTLEYPLLADGVATSSLYPLDTARAFRKLDTVKNQVAWWDSGAASVQNIVNGDCAMGVTWQGRPALRVKQDPQIPIAVSWDKVLLIDSGWAIPKGAAHVDAANSLLGYDFTAKNQCNFINTLGYGIPIDPSCVNDFGRTWGVTDQHRAQTSVHQSSSYYAKNIADLTKKFNDWLTS
jgi:putative spermidine/putrescine transport system substrate-binding protein